MLIEMTATINMIVLTQVLPLMCQFAWLHLLHEYWTAAKGIYALDTRRYPVETVKLSCFGTRRFCFLHHAILRNISNA